jgi:hypothetical protein
MRPQWFDVKSLPWPSIVDGRPDLAPEVYRANESRGDLSSTLKTKSRARIARGRRCFASTRARVFLVPARE